MPPACVLRGCPCCAPASRPLRPLSRRKWLQERAGCATQEVKQLDQEAGKMTKGYMVFVEGTKPPAKVHRDYIAALVEAKRLARKYPGNEVMLYQLHKRLLSENGEKPKSIGSHFPEDKAAMVNK